MAGDLSLALWGLPNNDQALLEVSGIVPVARLVGGLVGNLALALWDLPNNYQALLEVSGTPPVARLAGFPRSLKVCKNL